MSVEFPIINVSRISGNKFVEIRLRASRLAACEKITNVANIQTIIVAILEFFIGNAKGYVNLKVKRLATRSHKQYVRSCTLALKRTVTERVSCFRQTF